MPDLIFTPRSLTDALGIALARGVMPTAMSTAELREIPGELRARSVFSARTTNAEYVQVIRDVVSAVVDGQMDHATARVTLRETLRAMGYSPEGGFPGKILESSSTVPAAVKGSLRDLSSFRRLDLIVKTQEQLMRGAGQKLRGLGRLDAAPAWELVRYRQSEVPRNWGERFIEAGGTMIEGRVIAHKNDPVWDALGDSVLFDDALDVDHPPFAFNSGMGWMEVTADEWERVGGEGFDGARVTFDDANRLPTPKVSTRGLDADFVQKIKEDMVADGLLIEEADGKLSLKGVSYD